MDPYGQVGTTPFHLAHQGGPDLDLMTSLAGVYDAAAPSLRYTSPHCRNGGGTEEGLRGEELLRRPIRIGRGEVEVGQGRESCFHCFNYYLLLQNGDAVAAHLPLEIL